MSLHEIDWSGISWRRLRGWHRRTQCLARCGSMHNFDSRWCLLNTKNRSKN